MQVYQSSMINLPDALWLVSHPLRDRMPFLSESMILVTNLGVLPFSTSVTDAMSNLSSGGRSRILPWTLFAASTDLVAYPSITSAYDVAFFVT